MHGKDQDEEAFLDLMNRSMLASEIEIERSFKVPELPVSFVLGPPRGGTTVLSQLISSSGLWGTVSNFVSKFWLAPTLGIMIEKATGVRADRGISHFRSTRGRTDGLSEPSEFGYFWSRFFDLGQETHCLGLEQRRVFDRVGLARCLAAMEAHSGLPMAFKNNTWFTLNADLLAEIFPQCVLIVCDRDPFFVAQSLWLQRNDLFAGDSTMWWSVRPTDYARILTYEPLEQVAAQAASIRAGMLRALDQARTASIVSVPYEKLCAQPRHVVVEIASHVGIVERKTNEATSNLPEVLDSTNRIVLADGLAARLRDLVDKHCRMRGV